jgi:DNA polymerase I-like protein with 3'-5' exonuclease and polymerase domains
MPKKYFTCLI